ncbi:MAG TPA: hypothetical protein VF150_09140 [Thermoanaerobaculia bacterium]
MPDLVPLDFPGNQLLAIAFGLALLLAGRRVFWLVLGVVGFLFGFDLADRLLGLDSRGLGLVIGVLAGLLGVFIAIFLQKFAVGAAGFLIGGYVTLTLLQAEPGSLSATDLIAFVVGGLVCAFLALWLFEVALILLSAVAGSALVLQALDRTLDLEPAAEALGFAVLVVLGIAVQAGIGPRRRRRRVRE